MKSRNMLLLGVMCASRLSGQVPITISDDVRPFLDKSVSCNLVRSAELKQGRVYLFNQGDGAQSKPAKLTDIEKDGSLDKWKNQAFSKFYVKYPQIDGEICSFYRRNIQAPNLVVESKTFDGDAVVWSIGISDDQERELSRQYWHSRPTLTLDELKKIGVEHLRRSFKQFSGQLEYLTEEAEYEFINDRKTITEVRLRFARRFHDAIVLGNVAYVYVIVDGGGNLKGAKIKWPIFEEAEPIQSVRSFSSTLDEVTAFCHEGGHLKLRGGTGGAQPTSASITGAARAWIPERMNGQVLIGPAVSYSVSTQGESGSRLAQFVNVPLSKQDEVGQAKFFHATAYAANEGGSGATAGSVRGSESGSGSQSAPTLTSVRK